MIPIRDDNPTIRPPVVTVALIVINAAVFIYQSMQPMVLQERFIYTWGAIPALLAENPSNWLTLISSMFLHGGIAHIGGNMLYLWIFGNNIEDYLGHVRFVLFYLICGIAAALSHALIDMSSVVPMIGASGAISGILGGYLLLYPHARVVTIVWILFFLRFVHIPAGIVLGIWFVMQLSGVLGPGDGIAWYAHIGGFIAGALLVYPFGGFRRARSIHARRPHLL